MNNMVRFGVIFLVALIVFVMAACGSGADNDERKEENPGVVSVKVAPNGYIVHRGTTQTFIAGVSGTTDKAVTWSIEGDGLHAHTTIGQDGTLSVSADEEQTALTVIATLAADATIYGTAAVTVPAPTVTAVDISLAGGILINPWNSRNKAMDIDSGNTQQFLAKVVGENFPSQEVEWSIDGTVSSGTSINGGLLTVSSNQPQNSTFTIQAASKADEDMLDRITVTVRPPTISFLKVDPSSTTISATVPVNFTVTVLGTGNIEGLYEIEWEVKRSDGLSIAVDTEKKDDDGEPYIMEGTKFKGNTLHMGPDEALGEWTGETDEVGTYTPYPAFTLDVTATVTSDTLSFSPSMETSKTVSLTPEESFVYASKE